MKKIIATVLAMVMALALCTTAFAAVQTYDFYDAKTGVSTGLPADETLTYTKAVTKAPKAVAYYTCDTTTNDSLQNAKLIECDAADADYIVKYHDSSKVAMYVKAVTDVTYVGDGKAYTNFGKTCGQFKLDNTKYDEDTKFYTAVDKDDNVILFVEGSAKNLLVDGKLVAVDELGKLSEKVVQHVWVVDRNAMTAKCSTCGATAKLYKTVAECGTNDYEQVAVGLYAVVDTKTTPSTDTNKSPKTFDAGIAMYVGMALTSVAGSAVVIGKKKEF